MCIGNPCLRAVQHPLAAVQTRRCYRGSCRHRCIEKSTARTADQRKAGPQQHRPYNPSRNQHEAAHNITTQQRDRLQNETDSGAFRLAHQAQPIIEPPKGGSRQHSKRKKSLNQHRGGQNTQKRRAYSLSPAKHRQPQNRTAYAAHSRISKGEISTAQKAQPIAGLPQGC